MTRGPGTSCSDTRRARASSGTSPPRSTAANSAQILQAACRFGSTPIPVSRRPGIGVALAGEKALDGVTFTGERAPFRLVEVEWICAPTDGVCDARGSRSGRNPSSATWPRIPVTGRHIFPTVGKVDD